ncbi:MAG: type III pantothenate kinase [Clostridia bacterium]|nr:type III pantothenate kinase [Clostridia bacterium]MBQ8368512.1 type III pantothenate kinase [Clostridia bacterium]MBQ8513615.1 type III pantothenate kinase [Clostridia bacterium]
MLLAFDIGNSSITIGAFRLHADGTNELVCRFGISARAGSTSDEYVMFIRDYLEHAGIAVHGQTPISGDAIDCAVISSVVPGLTHVLSRAAKILSGSDPFIITPGIHTGFGIRIKDPAQLGADIVSNAAYSLRLSDVPLVILDMGTATTLTVVDKNADIIGTIILPGLRISMDALTDSAALLNGVSLDKPEHLIGRDSRESILSGVIGGHILMIDGFLRNIREELNLKETGEKLGLVSTGGLAECIIPHTRNRFTHEPSLTLYGAAELYRRNVK